MSTYNEIKSTHTSGLPFAALAGSAQSWPEDYGDENGNYWNECASCRAEFIGHKRRVTCKLCYVKNEARWAAMSQEERDEETARTAKELAAIFAQNEKVSEVAGRTTKKEQNAKQD